MTDSVLYVLDTSVYNGNILYISMVCTKVNLQQVVESNYVYSSDVLKYVFEVLLVEYLNFMLLLYFYLTTFRGK